MGRRYKDLTCTWPETHDCNGLAGSGRKRTLSTGSTKISPCHDRIGTIVCQKVFQEVKRQCKNSAMPSVPLFQDVTVDGPAASAQAPSAEAALRAALADARREIAELVASQTAMIQERSLMVAQMATLRETNTRLSLERNSLRRRASALVRERTPSRFSARRLLACSRARNSGKAMARGVKQFATFIVTASREGFQNWYSLDAVRSELRHDARFARALDLLDFVEALDRDNPQGGLAAAYVLAKRANQQANIFPKDITMLLHLRGASDRALGALAAAGLCATPANVHAEIAKIFRERITACVQKLQALQDDGPYLVVLNIDDFHIGAVLRYDSSGVQLVVHAQYVCVYHSIPNKTSSSDFAHMATELVTVPKVRAIPHNGAPYSQLLDIKVLKDYLKEIAPKLALTYMASTFKVRAAMNDVTGLMRTHDYDAEVTGACLCHYYSHILHTIDMRTII